MTRFVAFLRAINVGGHTVTMDALRRLFEDLGLTEVETFIASGNVLFASRSGNRAALTTLIEDHLGGALGFEVATFLRTRAEVAAIAAYQPFTAARVRDAGALCVGFLATPLPAAATKSLMALKTSIDDFHVHGAEAWWICAKKQSESKFSNAVFERKVGVRVTFRGAATVAKLAARL